MANDLERELLENELRPRLSYLIKGERGYGFHLHGERNRGAQYIRKIEPGSPADLAGLRSGDRVVEVNGENVEKDSHHQVVQKILAVDHRTRLLVVDRQTDEFLRFHGLPCTEERAVEMGSLSPRSSAFSSFASSPHVSVAPSPRASVTPPCTRESPTHRSVSNTVSTANTTNTTDATNDAVATATETDASAILHNGNQRPSNTPIPANGNQTVSSPRKLDPPTDPYTQLNEVDISTEETGDGDADAVMQDHRPRLCHIAMGDQGYGFNLHSNKSVVGQYIRAVDPGSPAERAGLRPRDRVVEVNGLNIVGMRHSEVVALIRRGGKETNLLVVDPETDELFKRLDIPPTSSHLKEDCVDGPIIEGPVTACATTDNSVSPSPILVTSVISPPIINITLTDPPIRNGSPRHQSYISSSSQSTVSEISTELSSSDTSNKSASFDSNERDSERDSERDNRRLDPFLESGLCLSPTAAEAKQKVQAKRTKKRAPPMDWSKKQEVFSNF